MPRRHHPDPDFEHTEETALAADIEDYERHRRMLAELSEIARGLAGAKLAAALKARIARSSAEATCRRRERGLARNTDSGVTLH